MADASDRTHFALLDLLGRHAVPFELTTHEPVETSEEAARVRGSSLASGARAMLMHSRKAESRPYVLLVYSAARSVNWKAVRKHVGRDYKLAEAACVDSVTGCLPGAVPPFGSVFTPPVPTIVDPSLVDQGDEITFNAGLRTHSIKMRVSDYLRVEVPTVVEFVADAV